MKSKILTFIVTIDNLSLLNEAIINKLGCEILKNDLLSMTITSENVSFKATIIVWNHNKFNELNAL